MKVAKEKTLTSASHCRLRIKECFERSIVHSKRMGHQYILRIKRSSLVSYLTDKRGSPSVIFIWLLKEKQKERGEE